MSIRLYHITHIDNLPHIVGSGWLWCDAERRRQNFPHTNIAHQHIKKRRLSRKVPVPPGGTLADYVPFYFAPRSPMLYTINRGNVEGYPPGSQHRIVYLVTTVQDVVNLQKGYCFTDRHAELHYAQFYIELSELLAKVDWDVMKLKHWSDAKEERQAEFLVRESVPWTCITEIGVIDADMQQETAQILRNLGHHFTIGIHRDWYY